MKIPVERKFGTISYVKVFWKIVDYNKTENVFPSEGVLNFLTKQDLDFITLQIGPFNKNTKVSLDNN